MILCKIENNGAILELHKLIYQKHGVLSHYYKVYTVLNDSIIPGQLIDINKYKYPKFLRTMMSIPLLTDDELAICEFRRLTGILPVSEVIVVRATDATDILLIKYNIVDYTNIGEPCDYIYCICTSGENGYVLEEIVERVRDRKYTFGFKRPSYVYESNERYRTSAYNRYIHYLKNNGKLDYRGPRVETVNTLGEQIKQMKKRFYLCSV